MLSLTDFSVHKPFCLITLFRLEDLSKRLKAEKRSSNLVSKRMKVLEGQVKIIDDNRRIVSFYRNECARYCELQDEKNELQAERDGLTKK